MKPRRLATNIQFNSHSSDKENLKKRGERTESREMVAREGSGKVEKEEYNIKARPKSNARPPNGTRETPNALGQKKNKFEFLLFERAQRGVWSKGGKERKVG